MSSFMIGYCAGVASVTAISGLLGMVMYLRVREADRMPRIASGDTVDDAAPPRE